MLPAGVTSLLSALGSAWLPVLVDAAVKGTVVLIVASVVSLFVRRASAATRHLVWFLALVGLLGLPALCVALPGWQVLPGWFGIGRTAALDAEAAASVADEPAVPPDSPPWSAGRPAGRPEASPSHPRPPGAASGTPPAPAAGAWRPWSAMNLWIWILPLWAAGAALSLAPVAMGLVSLRRLRGASRRVADGPWASLLERLSAELGLKRRVALLRSSRRSMPMAWGLVRPKLLIPGEADVWSAECLRAVLLHELAHIRRWDCLTQLVARMACGLYWFNPLAWLALRRMVAEHERACDDVVLDAGGRAPEYAEHLLKVASRLPAVRLSMGVGIALARPSRLEGRLLAILDRKRSRRAVTWGAALAAVIALVCLVAPLAALRPMVQAEQATAEKTKDARTLDLRGKKATDADLARLKEAGDLDVLYVSGDGITDAGLKVLRDFAGEGAGARPTLGPSAASEPAAPPRPAATPILKIRSTDGAAVADVHDGVVRVRLRDKTLEGPTIIISLDSGAGTPGKGIVLGVRDDAVRMTANGTETIGASVTIHPDGRTEVRSREATDGSLKAPVPAGHDAVRPVEPGRAESGNALPADDGAKRAGQRVFPLKYQEADASEAVVSGNTFQRRLPEKPAEIKAAPTGLSGEAVYFSLTVGPRKVLALLEVASPPRLFVDVAGTGDLSAVQPLAARPWGPVQQFGPVDIPVTGTDKPPVRVRFLCVADKYLAANKDRAVAPADLAVAPAGYMAGKVSVDGQSYRVALVDHGLRGRYDNVLRGEREFGWLKEDTRLALDLNQDGDFPRGPDTGETLPLLPTLHVKDAYYSVRAASDGSSIALASAAPDFGALDTGCADLGLALVGEYGFHKLSGSGGKWRVPAGWHAATGATLNRTDEAGTLWSLHGVSSWGRLARFDVPAGQALSLRAGSPLSVKVHPSGLQPNGMIHFALALVGQAGEDYNAAAKKGGIPQPPRFRVLDEAGRAIGSGVFNPGTEHTYSWCWWRVPEGFRGKYRVEVEGDWGPFEVIKAPLEWFSIQ